MQESMNGTLSCALSRLMCLSVSPRRARQCLLKSVDNREVLGRFPADVSIALFITNNITPCLMIGGALLIYNAIDVQYRFERMPTPPRLALLLTFFSVTNFIGINVATATVYGLSEGYYVRMPCARLRLHSPILTHSIPVLSAGSIRCISSSYSSMHW
jgi:hypothetical protein